MNQDTIQGSYGDYFSNDPPDQDTSDPSDHDRSHGRENDLDGGDDSRSERSTGGGENNRSERATGQNERFGDSIRQEQLDSRSRESNFSLTGERGNNHEYHLIDNFFDRNSNNDRFSLGDFEFNESSNLGERSSGWMGNDVFDSTRELGNQGLLDSTNDFLGGFSDFFRNYTEMKVVNTIGADKYFHCLANCESSQRGPGGELASEMISYGREGIDSVKNLFKGMSWKDSIDDCRGDLEANRVGREAGKSGERCNDSCQRFRPRGL